MKAIHRDIIACEACPRLRKYCQSVAKIKRRAYQNENYWGKPISGFGPIRARLVIVGLAPAAHGANRTGRIFTGDRSGQWLYRALHKSGFANQPTFERADDGLKLIDTYITCVVKCAPPDNKPLPSEVARCSRHLDRELVALGNARVWLVLGQIALNGFWDRWLDNGKDREKRDLPKGFKKPKFGHGNEIKLPDGTTLLMSYHPSQQNTFTGRLTEEMFDQIFKRTHELIDASKDKSK
jgi:uracil-DNA glycosylase family 4